ncbi:hypothetical protein C5167_040586 [Papaver somniferum]|uniref:FAR1 domain-containing protein n=2 Tax=Papaver somniferum TaxID=3469 RepID=A0A4Y7IIV2_PAPSO|nr:protein FAR1-RELATED SEQUENCE 5-like isoform X2 [Papaver somniferum]RZC47631.1 hypothetical protein C5167_040586 [Papaver somniferum]
MTDMEEDTGLPTNGKDLSKPAIYMRFSSIEEAENYYKEYGNRLGFSVRKRSSYATARGPLITRVIFVCDCEGIYVEKPPRNEVELKKKRNTSTMKTGCKAMIRIAFDIKHKMWYINEFIEKHNHPLISPNKRHLMRSNKYMPPAARCLAEQFNKQRLPVGKVASLFGNGENIGFTPRDVYNHLRTVRESLIEVGDAEALMNYFRKRTIENPSFYYAFKTDEVGRAANIFWVDAR